MVRFVFSDDLPSGFDEIIEVTPQGPDVRIRVIRLSLADRDCGGQLVRASERIVADTTVSAIAKTDVCALSTRHVDAAIEAAQPSAMQGIFDTESTSIVAMCAGKERAFFFPYPEKIDVDRLTRYNPEVRKLWQVGWQARKRAFGENYSINGGSSDEQRTLEAFGARVVPDLVSGRFQTAFSGMTWGRGPAPSNYLAERLKGYKVPPLERGPVPEVVERERFQFVKYVNPFYPYIARTARISGVVQLRASVSRESGLVTSVQVLRDVPLLSWSAVEAVRAWQFAPGSIPAEPIELTVRFSLDCAP